MKIESLCLVAATCIVLMVGCSTTAESTFVDGDYVNVITEMWCMESKEALSELQGAAARDDSNEMSRLFSLKGVSTLVPRDRVKILDRRFGGAVKVRTSADQECWTVANVLRVSGEITSSSDAKNQTAGSAISNASAAAQEFDFAIQVEKVGPRKLHIVLKTNLPEGALVTINGERPYHQAGLSEEYSGDVFPQVVMQVHSGKVELIEAVEDSRWVADHHEKVKMLKDIQGAIGPIGKVSQNVEVSAMFTPRRNQPHNVSAMVGLNGELMRGKHNRDTGQFHVLEDEMKIEIPFALSSAH